MLRLKKTLFFSSSYILFIILTFLFIMQAVLFSGCERAYLSDSKATFASRSGSLQEEDLSASQTEELRESRPLLGRHVRINVPNRPLADILKENNIDPGSEFNLYIDLQTRSLLFRHEDNVLKRYRIGAGRNTSQGDKEREGDLRTPRGEFYICSKVVYEKSKTVKEGNLGTRWMQLSYPNIEAADRGLENNLISKEVYDRIKEAIEKKETPPQNTPLGSAIGIHGGAKHSFPRDWTAGCIGMYDKDIEEIFDYLKIGDRVQIRWGEE
ncbi:MAG TPA: L,D-transpeptidase [Clostridiaceae bacterium]|nr:L,D-transpeptidase [Clostridiaceae bacterium]